jgi:hypothetical protein
MNRLKVGAAVVALGLWVASYFLWMHYAKHRPTALDLTGGRTHPLHTDGAVVYLTAREDRVLYGLIVGGGTLAAVAVLLYFTERKPH